MAPSSLGNLRQHLFTTRINTALKKEMQTLTSELSSGEKTDLTKHLGSQQTRLAGVDRQLNLLEQFSKGNQETEQLLSTMQSVLDKIDTDRSLGSDALLKIDDASLPHQVENASEIAKSSFVSVVSTLNTRFDERSLFGGRDLNTPPLEDAEQILSELRNLISGLSTTTDISNAIDAWFDTSGGGFETLGYLGDSEGFMSRAVNESSSFQVKLRADDPGVRAILKPLAKAALVGEDALSIPNSVVKEIQAQAGVELFSASAQIAGLQSRIGFSEALVEEATVRIAAERTSLSIARNEMVTADPYETASRLQNVQVQLEMHFTLTARLSRLNLTEYLR